uniref:ATP-dependent zinc metalloprotease FtsH n=1 Tax=Ndongobacter massiliensis TaxID=1871025 RepID=UPI000930A687|nr:ATP-dependent zinc metalloprotease FtsH [Ndongobacter massiliensis]
MNKRTVTFRMVIAYLLPMALLLLILSTIRQGQMPQQELSVNDFRTMLKEDQVKSVHQQEQEYRGVLKDKTGTEFKVYVPTSMEPEIGEILTEKVAAGSLVVFGEPKAEPSVFLQMLPDFLFIGIMIFFLYSMNRRNQAQSGGMNAFGKSKARLNRDQNAAVKFADVAGLKEEKEELMEIVDFLKNPKKFSDVGARIPKGVLLVGPPGTGKTYLSRAVAGEAQVPFYSISGSDFVEMFVGVGASRVRDLFVEGKKNAPCIIFIDEIDAVGRRRGAGLGGGNDEREQTLNQLLVEMDGFDVNEGIIIMAATNRPDILDPAILRPGRFDRQVYVGMPDLRERVEILKVHLRNKRIAKDVDLDAVARATGGFTPADLENVCNEAALLTARNGLSEITPALFEEATIKVVAGPEKKSRRVIEEERKLTAYHEAGHAIVTRALPGTDEVNMITIVPRGRAGGFTAFLPEDDRSFRSRKQMLADLVSFLGGRAAEDLILDDISTGASNDIERATKLARSMIVRYGMSPQLGPVSYEEEEDGVFLGKDFGRVRAYSEETAVEIDQEVRAMIEKAYKGALQILKENRELLHRLAERLLECETIRREEFETLFQESGTESQLLQGVKYDFV